MTFLNLDAAEIELTCPQCGHQFKETLGRLKNDPKLVCPGCSSTIAIEAEGLRDGLESAQESVADFAASIQKLSR